MRTVIQSMTICPELVNFMPTIFAKMVQKRVWENKILWDGFVKSMKMKQLWPTIFDVLLQLPLGEFKKVVDANAEMKEPLLKYVSALKNVNPAIINMLK